MPASLHHYTSVGAGCGMGQSDAAAEALSDLFSRLSGRKADPDIQAHTRDSARNMPGLVLDADALNIISTHPDMLRLIPSGAVLTPHIGELSRLLRAAVGSGFIERTATGETDNLLADGRKVEGASYYPWQNDMDKVTMVRALSRRLASVIVVKGAHTMICSPDGKCFFNMTGNPGMAKGGSGDILTGLIAGLAARGYDSFSAAVLGVWFHGVAGDKAAFVRGMESMNSTDILDCLQI